MHDERWKPVMLARYLAVLYLLVLSCACAPAWAQEKQCAEPRNLCPDPGLCFVTQQAQDNWADENDCTFITMDMLAAVDADGSEEDHREIIGDVNKYARKYEVNTPERMAHFLSQIAHESGFQATTESLSYSSKRMRQVFGCKGGQKNYDVAKDDCKKGRLRDKLWTQGDYYTHNSEHLGNYVYADRLGNGDEASGDGYKYRGRGLIQITGKDNYSDFEEEHNRLNPDDQQSFVDHPELVADNVGYAMESAFYFWSSHGLNTTADTGTVSDVTEAINGGDNGLSDRKKRFNAVACLLGVDEES
jgi:predicted chitinase